MMFRDQKTGKPYASLRAARRNFCNGEDCDCCPLGSQNNGTGLLCSAFTETHPEMAARLMDLMRVENPDDVADVADVAEAKKPTRRSILRDAERCVCGDRDAQYGSPETSLEAIADFWGAYLWNKYDLGQQKGVGKNFITPEDAAAMMVLFKMARVATGSYSADSWVDAAGYAACGGEIEGGKK